MGKCDACGGGCGGCKGCAGSLVLTEAEVNMLIRFAELPFLPVLRKPAEELPLDPQDGSDYTSQVLICLEKKGLVDIDYHQKLKGYDYTPWEGYLQGSMALTARGQEALDALNFTGAGEE